MWFLLVTTLACAVLADGGYLYNVPLRLPHGSSQTANIHSRHYQPQGANIAQGIQDEDKSITYSISYKDYVYLKKDNNNAHLNPSYQQAPVHGHDHNQYNGRVLVQQHIQPNVGHSYNGYTTYSQPSAPSNNYNNNYGQYAHSNYQVAASTSNIGTNVGYHHSSPPPTNAGNVQPSYSTASASYTNTYEQPTQATVNQNSAYAQSLTVPDANYYNNYHQISTSASAVSPINGGNNVYVHSASGASAYNGYNSQSVAQQSNIPVNSGYNQAAQASAHNIGYNQVSTVSAQTNLNPGYSNSFIPSSNYVSNNGYSETIPTPDSTNLNTGFVQTSASSVISNFNNGNQQTLTPTPPPNLNTEYGLPIVVPQSTVNNDFETSVSTTAGDVSSTSYSQAFTGPTHINLNTDITESLSTQVSSLGSSFTETLTTGNANLNNGLVNGFAESNFNVANPAPVSIPNSPPVTPIIHKHIYFHVPPPEIEEPPQVVPPPPPPKKNYKILFIKVPSQESKSNILRLQQEIAQRQSASVEQKTLIYVLVKNPEEPKPVVLPAPKPSEHQVFFVKYDGSPFEIASQVNDEIDQTGTVQSIVPLEPGLVNGQLK